MPTALLPSLPLCQPSWSPGTPCTAPGDQDLARPPRSPAPARSPPQGHSAPRLLPGRRLARVSENLVQSPGFLVLSAPSGGALLSSCSSGRECPGERTQPVPALPVRWPSMPRTTPYWLPSPLLPSLTEVWPRGRPWASTVRERLCPTSASPPPTRPENTALLSV